MRSRVFATLAAPPAGLPVRRTRARWLSQPLHTRRLTTRCAQNELFALPVVTDQGVVAGRLVELPPPRSRLPREKPLPQPRAPTRWEAYAKEKGIVKRKRSAHVWDDDAGEWRGRHGYGRAGDPAEVPVIEAKAWEQTGSEDPFAAQTREKRTRVAAQHGRHAQNVGAAVKRGDALPPGVTLSSMLDGRSGGAALGARLGRDGLKQTAARVATASGGTLRLTQSARASVCAGGQAAVQPTARSLSRSGAPHTVGAQLRVNAAHQPAAVAGFASRAPGMQIPLPWGRAVGALTLKDRPCARQPDAFPCLFQASSTARSRVRLLHASPGNDASSCLSRAAQAEGATPSVLPWKRHWGSSGGETLVRAS